MKCHSIFETFRTQGNADGWSGPVDGRWKMPISLVGFSNLAIE
jgi:hypothetical protein